MQGCPVLCTAAPLDRRRRFDYPAGPLPMAMLYTLNDLRAFGVGCQEKAPEAKITGALTLPI